MDDNNIKTIDYQKLLAEGRRFLRTELNYGKLTVVEKLIVLLSSVAVVTVVAIFAVMALYFVSEAMVDALRVATGHEWLANVIVALALLLILVIVVLLRRQLIIDPISRFITRLLLDEKDNKGM